MKSKNYVLWGIAVALVFSLDSCKPKESAYRAAYEAARAKEIQENQVEELTPVNRPATTTNVANDNVQKEKVTVIDGAGIRQFSVVIGSFNIRTNAVSLKDRMIKEGYNAFLAQNERGMFRVIVATFSDKNSAVAERDRVKAKYPQHDDAWILDNQ